MNQSSLTIDNIAREYLQLNQGELYWLAAERLTDAVRLATHSLSALGTQTELALIAPREQLTTLTDSISVATGPQHVRLFEYPANASAPMAEHLLKALRASKLNKTVIIVLTPAAAWSTRTAQQMATPLQAISLWLRKRHCTLLVIQHGLDTVFADHPVLAYSALSGLASISRAGALKYQIEFWKEGLILHPRKSYDLTWQDGRFAARQEVEINLSQVHHSDSLLYWIDEDALMGLPAHSEAWSVFSDPEHLLAAALQAVAATVVIAINDSGAVHAVATQVNTLRSHCGRALKIVVRETKPCLRYYDHQVLLLAGANLVIPGNATNQQFLIYLNAVQGQVWARPQQSLPDIITLLSPSRVHGLIDPDRFVQEVDSLRQHDHGLITHQLLALSLNERLATEDILQEINLKRHGDFATLVNQTLYVFLFACPDESVRDALRNVFKLPVAVLFTQVKKLGLLQRLSAPEASQIEPSLWATSEDDTTSQRARTTPRPVLTPTRLQL